MEASARDAEPVAPAAALPRVLLVDDDAAVRRLVSMALDGLPLQLLSCADGAEALACLREAPVQVVITDLMMPGVSGLALLEQLQQAPALRQGAELVAFSAGIDAAMRQRLRALGVHRLLPKPASLQALEDTVLAAIASAQGPEAGGAGAAAPADESQAIAQHFGGDALLFHAFRRSCLAQFAQDLADGEAAFAAGDAAALRRLAHSLKGVLATLGHRGAAALALAVERAAAQGALPTARAPWNALSEHLQALVAPQDAGEGQRGARTGTGAGTGAA